MSATRVVGADVARRHVGDGVRAPRRARRRRRRWRRRRACGRARRGRRRRGPTLSGLATMHRRQVERRGGRRWRGWPPAPCSRCPTRRSGWSPDQPCAGPYRCPRSLLTTVRSGQVAGLSWAGSPPGRGAAARRRPGGSPRHRTSRSRRCCGPPRRRWPHRRPRSPDRTGGRRRRPPGTRRTAGRATLGFERAVREVVRGPNAVARSWSGTHRAGSLPRVRASASRSVSAVRRPACSADTPPPAGASKSRA